MELRTGSLERLVPDSLSDGDATGRETLLLHLERYRFAARHAQPGRALDIACGVGYGTRLLADEAPGLEEVVGADLAEEAVSYARSRYASPRTEFRVADALDFSDPHGFDTIVSLETVEHVPDPETLVARLVRLLRPGGVLVASVPTTPSVDVNPHHRHDFTERSFRALFTPHGLREEDCLRQVQPVSVRGVLSRSEQRMHEVRPDLLKWYLRHPAAACRRLTSLVRHGATNRYLTSVWRAPRR